MDKQVEEIKLPEPIDAEVPEILIVDPELGAIQAQVTEPEGLSKALDMVLEDQKKVVGLDNTLQDTKE